MKETDKKKWSWIKILQGENSDTETLGHWDLKREQGAGMLGGRMLCAPSGCHLSVFFLSVFVTKGSKCQAGPCAMNLCQHVQVITGHYMWRQTVKEGKVAQSQQFNMSKESETDL